MCVLRTLVGVSRGTLVCLRPVWSSVETLVAASNGDAVVIGKVPGLLVETRIRGPELMSADRNVS